MNDVSFSEQEKEELAKKICGKLSEGEIGKVLVFGSSNITYLTCGVVFPYMDQKIVHPVALYMCLETGRRILICTFDLCDIPKQMNWEGEVLIYALTERTPELSLAAALGSHIEGQIGIDESYTTNAQLKALEEYSPDSNFINVDETIDKLKLQKTDAEIRLLEIACRMGDRGFVSALNHTEGAALDALSYPVWEYAERFRVHAGEFGGSGVGNMSVLQGKAARDLFGPCSPRAVFNDGEFIRLEYSMHNHGYWITGSRTVYVGESNEAVQLAYKDNQKMKKAAFEKLVVGNFASDVYAAVSTASEKYNIPFWQDIELGHGVGTSEREAPFIAPYDQTILSAGMVVSIGVYTYGPEEEMICNRDVYLLTEDGPVLLTWYKNFDDLYVMFGTSARHG